MSLLPYSPAGPTAGGSDEERLPLRIGNGMSSGGFSEKWSLVQLSSKYPRLIRLRFIIPGSKSGPSNERLIYPEPCFSLPDPSPLFGRLFGRILLMTGSMASQKVFDLPMLSSPSRDWVEIVGALRHPRTPTPSWPRRARGRNLRLPDQPAAWHDR
ncbi:uncharacterized protein BJX67DRAFT_238254 [Aspergillus lucknowensis]|uniref:Uncharacterized protein n=1 Tax=Aspergillus lucknowensis TaxID=176173 RepID=A0ABR4LGV0_9EURO